MKTLLPTTLNSWLLHPGSFMERLREHGVNDAIIRIIFENFAQPSEIEAHLLSLNNHENAWIREVIIESPGRPWMFARTVIPRETLTGEEKALQFLQNRSLGSFLFEDKNLMRSAFEFYSIEKNTSQYQHIKNHANVDEESLSSRYSVFTTHGKKIFLQEVFFETVGRL